MKRILRSRLKRSGVLLILLTCLYSFAGCGGDDEPASNQEHIISPISNRIEVPPAVRRNLGIDFAVVEERAVKQTRRIPGAFELQPEAVRDYHSSVRGHVELFVKQFQEIRKGALLFRVDSPEWHIMRHELGQAVSDISIAEAGVHVAIASYEEGKQSSEFLDTRVANLKEANVRRADLDAELLKSKKTVARLNAELAAARAGLEGARLHLSVMLTTASSTAEIPKETLSRTVRNSSGEEAPFWQTVNKLDVYAKSDGIVDELFVTNGSWVEQGARVMKTVDPVALRFRADAPQTDIQYYKNGQNVLIVPSEGASINLQKTMGGRLIKGYRADSQQRTLPLYVVPDAIEDWAAPGVSAYMEVLIKGDDRLQMAAPLSCIVRDGLVDIFFRRDPKNPDFVIRMEADLGENDGRWVVLRSGVRVGDEIVMNGAYQLKLAGVGKTPNEAGHFHADGTWHSAAD